VPFKKTFLIKKKENMELNFLITFSSY